jgi:exopolyphosphatase/guanosine-5'-triphosphate,3'-diphosphate pyrophosphatase
MNDASSSISTRKVASDSGPPPSLLAVIEIGTTSIRMVIAEPCRDRKGKARILDSLQQTVSLGRDTFTTGAIGRKTTEACVSALISFRQIMREYGIDQSGQFRAIASSAVREATNRESFIDRILIATGIQVTVIEEAEVNRLTYRAVRPVLGHQRFFKKADTLVVEVGGGSTETLLFHRGRVTRSHMHSLGSLRLTKSVEGLAVSRRREWEILRDTIDQEVERIRSGISVAKPLVMVALGADTRFAAALLHPEWDRQSLIAVTTEELESLVSQFAEMSVEDLVKQHHLSYEEAETIRPALLITVRLAQAFHLRRLFVADVNLRSGLLAEMDAGGNWTDEFKRQIVSSTIETARRYQVNIAHAQHVCAYAMELFAYLRRLHDFSTRDEMILTVAALLHEVGRFVSTNAHHKHAWYLIRNSDIFGLGTLEVELAAQVARYHRRSAPKPTHTAYMQLRRADRLTVSKLAAILRVANALDCLKGRQRVPIKFREHEGTLILMTDAFTNLPIMQQTTASRADLFEQMYGLRIAIRQKTKDTQP